MSTTTYVANVDALAKIVAQEMDCVICLDLLDDPVFCSDGFVYCRNCIGQWAIRNCPWKSPSTNTNIYSPAILIRDFRMNSVTLDVRRKQLRESLMTEKRTEGKLVTMAGAFHANLPISTNDQNTSALSGCCKTVDPLIMVEMSFRSGRSPSMSTEAIRFIISEDSMNCAHHRLRLEVLRHILKNNTSSRELTAHIHRRIEVPDAIRIDPELMRCIGAGVGHEFPVYCTRKYQKDRMLVFSCEDVIVSLPIDVKYIGVYETQPQLELSVGEDTHLFPLTVDVLSDITDRLCEPTVFPDYDGNDVYSGEAYDERFSVFEKLPQILPELFTYIPRWATETTRLRASIFDMECRLLKKRRHSADDS
jgi:hypothetical protein